MRKSSTWLRNCLLFGAESFLLLGQREDGPSSEEHAVLRKTLKSNSVTGTDLEGVRTPVPGSI